MIDRPTYAVIRARRAATDLEERHDILSLLLQARTEEGEALDDKELRDELLTLVLAGHETTANSLAWAWERLVRNPGPHEALLSAVRSGAGPDGESTEERVEATIVETMRSRPVIPIIGRRVQVPWRLGDYAVEPGTAIAMSILLVHHREDVYPDPFAFRPERFLGRKPGTYDWIPFGGGIRRCLGAALAMAEQRVVLTTMARRLDLEAETPAPERAMHRNVTMIPAEGARVVIAAKHCAPTAGAVAPSGQSKDQCEGFVHPSHLAGTQMSLEIIQSAHVQRHAIAPPSPSLAALRCQSRVGSSPAARSERWAPRARSRAREARLPGRARHSEARAAHGRRAEAAARGRHRRASLRPLGGDRVHVGHHAVAGRAVIRVFREPGNLRGKSRPPPLALSHLGDRLAGGLRSSDPPLTSDVLQSAPTLVSKT